MAKAAATLLKVAGILLALTATVIAQDYPTKPVRLIVPFAPGGSVDVIARSIAMQLGERLGRQVVVDNRPGASGIIATELAVNAAPDGHTLLMLSFTHAPSVHGFTRHPMIPAAPLSGSPCSPRASACSASIQRCRPVR